MFLASTCFIRGKHIRYCHYKLAGLGIDFYRPCFLASWLPLSKSKSQHVSQPWVNTSNQRINGSCSKTRPQLLCSCKDLIRPTWCALAVAKKLVMSEPCAVLRSIYFLSCQTGTWTYPSLSGSAPAARWYHSAVMANGGKMWIFGGGGSSVMVAVLPFCSLTPNLSLLFLWPRAPVCQPR